MTLPRLMRGDCGHFIPADSRPTGEMLHPLVPDLPTSIYLCPECAAKLPPQPIVKRGPGRPRKA